MDKFVIRLPKAPSEAAAPASKRACVTVSETDTIFKFVHITLP